MQPLMIMGIILTGGGATSSMGLDRVITRSVGIASYLVESLRDMLLPKGCKSS